MKLKLLFLLFLSSFSSFGQYVVVPHYVAKKGLIAYYPFNGNANDESGNQNHATVNGATLTTDKDDNLNSAYSFDGINSYIETNIANYPLKGESRSITGWFKATTPVVSKELDFCLLNYGNISDPDYWFKISFYRKGYLDLQFDSKTAQSQENYFNNKWTFFALTFDSVTNTYSLYINNVYKMGGTASLYTKGFGNLFRIGRNKLNNYFEGSIDDIGIWNRVLSTKEMSDLFTKTNKNPPPPTGITNIPDINFEKKLISIGLDFGNPDGQVPTSQIYYLTNLNIASSSISDLTGIQEFKALQTLNISNNQLTNLDITNNLALNSLDCSSNQLKSIDVSKNIALANLDCHSNQLTSLDVALNVALNSLSCYSNQLTSLDTAKNIALNTLYCYSNQLASLDVSKNIALEYLGCGSNQLTNLNLKNGKNTSLNLSNNASSAFTNNPNLTCIEVDNVIYSNTNWSKSKDATAIYTTSCTAQQYTLIPDLNFEKKLIALGIDSSNTDGKVLTSSISSLTSLDVSNIQITDLTGIQDFVALTSLNCSNNQLTSSDFSKNVSLLTLYCYNNKLTNLDISNNIILTNLDCSSNQLITLDVSKNIALTNLNCYYNHLSILEVSQNIALTNLDCGSNQLTSLDLYKNIALRNLHCSLNQLTSLEVSKNIALTNLNCYNNKLLTLDVSQNIALTNLNCGLNQLANLDVYKNTALRDLECSSNQLTSLDVSKNVSLLTLIFNSNKLITLDVSQNIALINLQCISNQLTSLDVSKNVAFTSLYCTSNQLTNLNLKNGNNVNFTTNYFNCTSNPNLSCIQVDDVAYSNANWGTFKDATASYNTSCTEQQYTLIPDINFEKKLIALGIDSGTADGKVLTSNIASLTYLDVSNSQIADLTGIQDFVVLKTLNCEYNQLTNLDVSKNIALTDLYCYSNQLTSLDVSKNLALSYLICSSNKLISLDVYKTLTYLSCNSNQLTSLDVSKNVSLTNLICSSNQLTTLDVSKNVALKNLYCASNQLTALNLNNGTNSLIVKMDLKTNPNLTCIQVDDVAYSNTKWSTFKDATASYNTTCAVQQYTLIPDVNFEKKLIALGIDSGATDGKVLTSNISSLTSLDVSWSSISSLTGIQDFGALTSLNCSGNKLTNLYDPNQLTSLDISKNVALTSLYCNSNQLTSLDVSKNVALTTLNCYSNQLTSLDVSKNIDLISLSCYSNQIKTLDISNNIGLISLLCNSNQLTRLNLKNGKNTLFDSSPNYQTSFINNPNLTCIQVDDATYSNTKWSNFKDPTASYNTSCTEQQYTLIPDINFERKLIALGIDSGTTDGKILTANISSLTSLDVSNSLIANLTGIQDFVSLTNLNCYNNQLTNIDVTKNIALTNLNCGLNQLASLDISKNTALTYLTCTNMQKLTTLDVSKNVALLDLYCYNNQLTALDISQNVALLNVHCMTNNLSTLDVSKNTALTTLWCSSNQLSTLDVSKNVALVNLKCNSNQLINLDLRNGNNTILSNSKSSSFTNNPNLTCIQVDNVIYSNANWSALKDATASYNTSCAVQQYTLIPDVNFEKKLIALGIDSGVTDGKVLTSSISSLTSLNVSWSSISNLTGIQDFVALTSLNCSGNKLTNLYDPNQLTGLDISKNVALTSLYCNSNQLTSLDVSKNTALKALNCSSNKLTTLDFSKNLVLSDLDCSYVNLTTLDVSKNTSLLALKCFSNQLTTLDVTKNSALKFLNCESNQLSAIDVFNNVSLDTLRCSSNKLIRLDVSKNVNLKRLFCSNNKLESLNLKNGNNSKIDVNNYNLGFSYNPDLTCIQVDDKTYSDANWSDFKGATASYSENCPHSSIFVSSEFEDKLIALGIDKDGKNGSVLLADITNVTSIDVSNSGITNLSGIEYFTDLETLICKGNSLTTINLSSNTALKYLDCSNNPLTALDVSKNILLRELYFNGLVIKLNKISNSKISDSASLTTLNLTNNLLLTKLDCSNNNLTSLDVSKNTLLTDINCSNNSLQSLNVNNGNNTNMINVNFKSNSTLSCIKVDDDVFSNANWAGAKDATAIYSKTACTLGIDDVVFDTISIYPNPVKGQLHIDNIVLEKITVYNASGKLIKTTNFTNATESNTLDLNGLTKGIYFIYLQSEGTNIAKKIIVE